MKFRLLLYLCFSVVFITNAQTVEQDFARYKRLADQCFNQKNYDCARKNYSIANQLKSDSYCQQKINESNIKQNQSNQIKIYLAYGPIVGNLIGVYADKWGFMNMKEQVIVPFKYESFQVPNEGDKNIIRLQFNGKWGAVDLNGNLIIPFEFDEIEEFSENVAKVKYNGKDAVINKSGEVLFYLKQDIYIMDLCHEGVFLVIGKYDKYGFINLSGQIVIQPQYYSASSFHEGLSSVLLNENGLFGFIRKSGETFIPFKFKQTQNFSEGLAGVTLDHNKYGFINSEGKVTIPFIYDFVSSFSEGLAKVCVGNKCGYINKSNELKIPSIYDKCSKDMFESGLCVVCKGEKQGVIDKTGKIIVPIKYDMVHCIGGYTTAYIGNEEPFDVYRYDKFGNILFTSLRFTH